MTERDPLDDLLEQAFEADRARQVLPDVIVPVMRRIRRRQHARALLLGGAVVTGLLFTLSSGLDLTGLTSLFRGSDWLAGPPSDLVLLLAALLAGLGGLLAIEESST